MAAPSPSAGDAEGEGEAGVPISGINGHAYSSETEGEDCGAAGDGPDGAPKRSDSVDGEDVFEVEQILDVKTEEVRVGAGGARGLRAWRVGVRGFGGEAAAAQLAQPRRCQRLRGFAV